VKSTMISFFNGIYIHCFNPIKTVDSQGEGPPEPHATKFGASPGGFTLYDYGELTSISIYA
jgi:hypothetical protein